MVSGKVLVSGGTGFVGKHLVKRLAADMREVHILMRSSSDERFLSGCPCHVHTHIHDGSMEGMLGILKTVRPETVFHLAAFVIAEHQSEDITQLLTSNILFGTQLAEASVKYGVRNFINTGTFWQHYSQKGYDPVCLYAASKQAFTDILTYYFKAHGLNTLTLELSDTYGPYDQRQKLFQFIEQAICCGQPVLMSPGEQLIDLVYSDDVIEAYLQCERLLKADATYANCTFSICSDKPVQLKQIVSLYLNMRRVPLDVIWGGRPYRKREVMKPCFAPRLPGWYPHVSLSEGMRRIIEAKGQQN